MRCGETFGLSLFGMDVVISKGQPYVVDVNKFGSFIGVPDAPAKLADYVLQVGEDIRHARQDRAPATIVGD